jgi:ornithine carbamoyltransferase
VPGKDLLSISDLTGEEILSLITEAVEMKTSGRWSSLLDRKILTLLFEKPSLRTRLSFEVAMRQLGGQVIYFSQAEVGMGKREPVADVARVLSRSVDAIAARTFAHQTVVELARYAPVPVINALSDFEHPCQALADLLTVYENKGGFKGVTLAYIGDGNNVAHSLMLACTLVGMNFKIASPAGYTVQDAVLRQAQEYAADSGAGISCTAEPRLAAEGADVLYTDVWTSMGQESEMAERRRAFTGYQINKEMLALARENAIIMHDLPAHYGEEITEDVANNPQSVIFDQAENKMHVLKALLSRMLGGLEISLGGYRRQ